jgi:hypothetical protein
MTQPIEVRRQTNKIKRILFDASVPFLFMSGGVRKKLRELLKVFMAHLLLTWLFSAACGVETGAPGT